MRSARSADELKASQRPWVDPVNNLVFADVHGQIGYRTRGRVPVRSMANAWLPVPSWANIPSRRRRCWTDEDWLIHPISVTVNLASPPLPSGLGRRKTNDADTAGGLRT